MAKTSALVEEGPLEQQLPSPSSETGGLSSSSIHNSWKPFAEKGAVGKQLLENIELNDRMVSVLQQTCVKRLNAVLAEVSASENPTTVEEDILAACRERVKQQLVLELGLALEATNIKKACLSGEKLNLTREYVSYALKFCDQNIEIETLNLLREEKLRETGSVLLVKWLLSLGADVSREILLSLPRVMVEDAVQHLSEEAFEPDDQIHALMLIVLERGGLPK